MNWRLIKIEPIVRTATRCPSHSQLQRVPRIFQRNCLCRVARMLYCRTLFQNVAEVDFRANRSAHAPADLYGVSHRHQPVPPSTCRAFLRSVQKFNLSRWNDVESGRCGDPSFPWLRGRRSHLTSCAIAASTQLLRFDTRTIRLCNARQRLRPALHSILR